MAFCKECGRDINIENSDCKIHPKKQDYAIKGQLIVRELRPRIADLIAERREEKPRA